MPADENSADPGADHTPDENSESASPPGGGTTDSTEQDAVEPDAEEPDVNRDEAEGTGPDETGPTEPEPHAESAAGDEVGERETSAEGAVPGAEQPGDGGDAPETVVIDVDAPVATGAKSTTADSDGTEPRSDAAEAADGAGAAGTDDEPGAAEGDGEADSSGATGTDDEPGAAEGDGDADSSGATDAPEDTDDATTGAASAAGADGAPDSDEDADTRPGPDAAPENADAAAATSARGNKRKRSRLRRVVMWTSASLALILLAGVGTAYAYYYSLRSDMVQHDIEALLSDEERPDKISDAVNILFIGSDGYEEDSPAYSTEFEGERSDSLMLAHISPDNRVSVVSFPRDSLVQLPQCEAYGQTEGTYGYFGMINAAMYHGGPPCVVRTIESLTDIRVDHFVHLSFASFRDVVNAMGGVDMCIPEPMQDRRSKLDLPAGEQTLDGDQALSFVRARYDIGDGGDMGRIDRQQMFLAALADQVTSSDVLSSPSKLNGILQAVAQHSATDRELSLDRMLSIAVTMADVDLSDIEFHTVPWYQAPYDPNRVMWHEAEAAELFSAVREDRPLPALLADDAPGPQEHVMDEPTPVDPSPEAGAGAASPSPSARPGEGRDATSNPCQDGLGFGTGEEGW
ncbi:LCP family protein [Nocardiopsis sp. NPDC007018]|uniref:LCP family glycopolymer transferase n=1 Tax=Nocardiopsis sp. NPDC007018 TaxID=3155721 RepID=UPI0033C9E4F1